MRGRFCSLDQLYKKFSGNDVFPLPKLNKDQKKGLCRHFSANSGEDQKKKDLRRNLRLFSAEDLWDLLVLAGYFSSGHLELNS